jgi:hypothetical protein
MKVLLTVLFVLSAGTAYAAEDIVAACSQAFQQPDYRLQCIQNLSQRQAIVEGQQIQQEQLRAQQEAARQQALGLALFGSGPALINGMNQGFQQMQIKPYVLPPPQNYQMR